MTNHQNIEKDVQWNEVPATALQFFKAIPGNNLLVAPASSGFTIVDATDGFLLLAGISRQALQGRDLFEAFPSNPGEPTDTGKEKLRTSFLKVMATKEPDTLPAQRYDVAGEGGQFSGRYWTASNTPVINEAGDVGYIIHTITDSTAQVKGEQQNLKLKGLEQAAGLFRQSPVAIHMLKGSDLIIEMANKPALDNWGRGTEVIGKPLMEALPELKGQGYDKTLLKVLQTGKTKEVYEAPVVLERHGTKESCHFNFISKPYYQDEHTEAVGVVTVSTEVTDKVLAKKELEEQKQRLELAVEIAELGDFKVDVATQTGRYSQQVMEWFDLTASESSMENIVSKVHPDDRSFVVETLERSIGSERDGRHDITYRLPQKSGSLLYLRSIGQVQWVDRQPVAIYGIIQDVTSQVRARKEVEESQQELLALFKEAPVGIATISSDENLTFQSANTFYCELVDRKPEDLIGRPLLEALPEANGQGFDALLKEVIKTGEPFIANEAPAEVRRNGKLETLYLNYRYQPHKKIDGRSAGVLVVVTDVSQQVRARKKIEESEQKYRSLFASMNQGFCVFEMIFDAAGKPVDYRFLEINPVFEEQTGLKNAIGKTALELVPNLEANWFSLYGAVAQTGEPARFVQGSEAMGRWFDVFAFRMGDETSRKVALLFSDITERRKAEDAVRRSEQDLRNMILQAPAAMCVLKGEDFIIEVANEKMFELWGIATEGMVGKPLFEAVREAKNEGYEQLLTNVLKTGEPYVGKEQTVSLPRKDKVETVYINFSYKAVKEMDGTISGVMVMVVDVTEQVFARQKIEEVVAERTKELANANKELKRSNANLEEFAHAASHDLKEPVRKIHFFTHQLKEQLGDRLKENESRSFGRIEYATERMGALIDDLLLYSHVSQRPHEMETIDLNIKVKRVLEDLELDIEEKKAVIQIRKLPVVQGYKRQLQQLFQNLISNALKYSKAGEPPYIAISTETTNENGRLYHVIQVADNGIGFDEQYSEKIFQMFSRLHGKGEYSGTGVGLSIVKKVVENHNGFIRVKSEPGRGATFKIYLPA